MPVLVNRADFAWALQAALAHVGTTGGCDAVLIVNNAALTTVCATDRYTTGRAGVDNDCREMWSAHLQTREAKSLLTDVRPRLKADNDDTVRMTLEGEYLAVAVGDAEGVLFETVQREWSLTDIDYLIDLVRSGDPQRRGPLVYQPDLFARFAKAGRNEGDRMHVWPARSRTHGAALVEVGTDFVGAVAGLSWEAPGSDIGEVA